MEGDRVKIERLVDSSNWAQWKFQVRAILDARDALELIDGTHVQPAVGTANFDNELRRWKKANKIAKEIFATMIDKRPLALIMNCDTATEMWTKLLDIYEQKSADSIYLVQSQFREYRYVTGDDIATHVSKLESFSRRLSELGDPVSESMLMTTILNTLPAKYRHFHSAWDSTPATERTLSKLISRLMIEETRLGITDMNMNSETALVFAKQHPWKKYPKTKGAEHGGSSKEKEDHNRKKPNIRCWTCGGPHFRRNCPKKRQDDKEGCKQKESGQGLAFLNLGSGTGSGRSNWIIDSGCTEHVCWLPEYFTTYKELEEKVVFELADGHKILAEGIGCIRIRSKVDDKEHHLRDVMYVPDMRANLFSIRSMAEKGFKQTIDGNRWMFKKDNNLIVEGYRSGDMYVLDIDVIKSENSILMARGRKENSLQVWHERLGHQSKSHVRELLISKGIEVSKSETTEYCDGCALGKFQRTDFREMQKATHSGELVVTDVCGPMQEPSLRGFRYFVTFKDDYTQYRKVYFMKHKSEVKEHLVQYLAYVRNQTGNTVKTVMSDNGGEFTDQDFVECLEKNGIEIGRSAVYTPQQNGRAERENRTLLEMARTMLMTHGISKRFWAEALNCAAYVLNRTGKSREKGKTPYETWYEREYSLEHLRIFGSECLVGIPKSRRDDKKFGSTSKRGIFVGYEEVTGNYRVWIPEENQLVISRDVEFHEVTVPSTLLDQSQGELEMELARSEEDQAEQPEQQEPRGGGRYQLRDRANIRPPIRYSHLCQKVIEPQSYQEAMKAPEKSDWIAAMADEMDSHQKNNTWELVEPDDTKHPLTSKWVYRVKTKSSGEIERFKARLVVRGFEQEYGVNYDETFSPVIRYDTVRLLFWLIVSEKLEVAQFDCKTAFLNGVLEETIFMRQPEGFNDGSERICKLLRSLYGLKQAPRCWNQRLTQFLISIGFRVSKYDPCVYLKQVDGNLTIIAVYVDDGLILATLREDVQDLLNRLQSEFEITICNDVGQFLGFQVDKVGDNNLRIHQTPYAKETLSMFNMSDCKPAKVPVDKASLDILYTETESDLEHPIASAIGRLMYLVVISRPDLAFVVGKAAQWMSKPTVGAWKLIKHILRYIKGTVNMGIEYSGCADGYVTVFSDSDYGGDMETRRSTTGYVSTLGDGAITWSSQRQGCVALSTTESEYMAASTAAKELVWLTNLVGEFKSGLQARLLVDNQGAIRLSNNPDSHKRTKHIDIRYHHIRELVMERTIVVEYVESENQVADMFTKPLGQLRLRELCETIGLK